MSGRGFFGGAAARRALDALLVLLLAVPFYYYLRTAVKQGMRLDADSFRYLWQDVPLNLSYFFNSSFSVRVLYTLVGNVPNGIVKLQVVTLGLAQIALYLALRRGGALQRVLLAGALALFFGSEETHWWAAYALADSLHFSFWILFLCALAAYRGPGANLVIVLAGVLFAFSRNTAPYLALGVVLFYGLLNLPTWPRLTIRPALVILLAVSVGALWALRHLNPALEHHTNVRYLTDVVGTELVYRFHEDHGMPLGPFTATCRGRFTIANCMDADHLLMGSAHSREYEATRDDYGFVDWVRARGIDAWQRHLLADPGLYLAFLQSFPERMIGMLGPEGKNAHGKAMTPETRRATTPLAYRGTGAVPAWSGALRRFGLNQPLLILLLIAAGTVGYGTRWRDPQLALPLLLMASGVAGMFLVFAGEANAERHFWPVRLSLYLGIALLFWAIVGEVWRSAAARRAKAAPPEASAVPTRDGPPQADGRPRGNASVMFAVGLVGISVLLLYAFADRLRQTPLPLPTGARTAVLGLPAHEATTAAALLPDGDIVVVGRVLDPAWRGATRVHATGAGPGYDVFVARLDAALRRTVAYTVIGGSDDDHATAVAVGPHGDVYVSGFTRSIDFPALAPGRRVRDPAAQSDGFIARLSPDLSRIETAIRIGGADHDVVRALALDDRGRLYAAGFTASSDFPVGPDTAQRKHAGTRDPWLTEGMEYGTDGFVVRLDAGLRAVEAATYVGGSGDDQVYGLVLDRRGGVFVVGSTTSTDFPGAAGRRRPEAIDADAFVARLNPDLASIDVTAVFGGKSQDFARCATTGADGRLWVAGYTRSEDFPASAAAFQRRIAASASASGWIASLDAANLEITASTYLGGTNADHVFAITTVPDGRVAVTGETKSVRDFPGADAAGDARFFDLGREDIFVSMLAPDLSALSASFLVGGGGRDRAAALVVGSDGSVIVAGDTGTRDFPATDYREATMPDDVRHHAVVLKLPPTTLERTSRAATSR